jgi:hypothetical protein
VRRNSAQPSAVGALLRAGAGEAQLGQLARHASFQKTCTVIAQETPEKPKVYGRTPTAPRRGARSEAGGGSLVPRYPPWYPPSMAKIARTVSGLGLALFLGLALVPPACGGRQAPELSVFHGDGRPTVPNATVSKLQACVDRIRDPRHEIKYAFQFHVEVAEDGHVARVKHKGASPTDPGIESCLADALEGMRVPASAVEALTRQWEEAEAVSPSSRALMGEPVSLGAALLAALAGVELAPVVIVAGVVTVAVGVTVYVGEEVIDTIKYRRKRNDKCTKMFVRCQALGPPCTTFLRGCGAGGLSPCAACNDACLVEGDYLSACRCYSCGYE